MTYNPEIHKRKSIRLKGYDYSQDGLYFVTICTQNHECIFGEIVDDEMILNPQGEMIKKWWLALENKFLNFKSDIFVVMPNHFHAIMILDNNENGCGVGASLVGTLNTESEKNELFKKGRPQGFAPTKNTVGEIIGAFKSLTTNEYIKKVKSGEFPEFDGKIWQRNFHEHIIRNEKRLEKIQNYILYNPEKWEDDMFFRL